MNPPQGVLAWPGLDSYFQRGSSPLTIWYTGAVNSSGFATLGVTVDKLWAYPVVLGEGMTIDTIACEVTSLAAGSKIRVGIYSNVRGGLYPDALLLDSGEFSGASTGVKSTTGLAVSLAPGIYWFVSTYGVLAPNMRALDILGTGPILGMPIAMGASFNQRLSANLAYGALPASFPAGGVLEAAQVPLVAIHASA